MMLAILAALLKKLLIEDDVRTGAVLARHRVRRAFALVAAGTAVAMAVTAISKSYARDQVRLVAAKPTCFGAAARDPEHPCNNPDLRFAVIPTPSAAAIQPGFPCRISVQPDLLSSVCEFGVPPAKAAGTIAVVGDSHAAQWRAALEVVGQANRWRGISITRDACPFAVDIPTLDEPLRSQCIQWNREVLQWFGQHPEVSTVFVSAQWGGTVFRPSPSELGDFVARIAGYIAAWKALPTSVKHIIVIRDPPRSTINTPGCIDQTISKRERAGLVCALPRRDTLIPDPATVAAVQLHSRRVQVVDLTRFMCDSRLCYPVVGGALVLKDLEHLSEVFATTLGPFLLRQVDRLMASWG